MDNQDHQTLEEGLEHHRKDQNKQINPEGHIVQETGENFKMSKREKHNSSLIHCLRVIKIICSEIRNDAMKRILKIRASVVKNLTAKIEN